MEISVKEGVLHLQGVKFGKKSWRQIRVVLFAPSLHGVGRVELYNMRDGAVGSIVPVLAKQGLKAVDKRVIQLDDCLSVCLAPGEVCPADCSAFCLTTSQRTYILAAPAADDWVFSICELAFQRNNTKQALKSTGQSEDVLMEDNELYSPWSSGEYRVTVQRTEAAVRCNLSGSYKLTASTDALTLRDPHTTSPLYHWPYKLLRRFGNDKDTVTIEAGRRCDSGEGHFTFRSQDAAKIYRAIGDGIRRQTIKDPKVRGSSVPAGVSSSCSQGPLEDRTVTSSPLYHNTYQDMEVRRGLEEEEEEEEEEEDDVGQEEGVRHNSANAKSVYSVLSFNQGMGQPIRRNSNPHCPASPVISNPPCNFKLKLSALLTKDPAKTQPVPPPHPDY
ncbi:hypothetical protein GJAV_G00259400 [Gymnothorax javanicus]|nr:hypothetical protein GJAV_G00259400 [Gymnothorax javanicus]